jgi:hypothetical protein
MTPSPNQRLPRVLVLWETRLLTDAVAVAAKDMAEVIALARGEDGLEPLIRRVQPDAIVVDSHELVDALCALDGELSACSVL